MGGLLDKLILATAKEVIIRKENNTNRSFGMDAVREQILPDEEIARIKKQILSAAGLAA